MTWPRLYEELKAAGRAQGSEGAAVAPSTLYRIPWRAPHLHRTLHTITTGRLSSGSLHIPPKPGGQGKGDTPGKHQHNLCPDPKAKIKGLQSSSEHSLC